MTKVKCLLAISIIFLISCGSQQKQENAVIDISKAALIPKPVSVTAGQGSFQMNNNTTLYVDKSSSGLETLSGYLAQKLFPATGYKLNVAAEKGNNQIALLLSSNSDLKDEGYDLDIKSSGITITANKPAGIFNGIQTLIQLLPVEILKNSKQDVNWSVGAGNIHDYPSYGFRGAMLDVSRHFFSVDDVKRFIDLIASYKMNVLHLHLSDDQGWRIEIKSWPNLTNHGGSTQVGGGNGGFYTQDQYSDLVKYALDRFITIIPEIDMPGHTNAALSSYAVLNCNTDSVPPLYTKTEVGFSTLCVRKDSVYKFIDDVVRELAAITPGPYIHLGGDESHVTPKPDFIYFINRIQSIPKKYGKKMIGWEEIAQASLDSNTIVQYWSNVEHAKEAVKKGAAIIMSPASRTYLDMKYDSTTKLGQAWAGLIEVDTGYIWSLSDRVKEITNDKIMGVEAPLWTETISTMNDIEFMVFPRLPGIAEIGWTPDNLRNWNEYKLRLAQHGARMKATDIDFYESSKVAWGIE
ncbi:MAG TPA: beta-N-acetylhexosaminidase [Flavitalea sp.]|nr:beta-N-acetylhexosaminidase [Flavitalea sp.]